MNNTATEQQLIDAARKNYLGVHFDGRAKRNGLPHIRFMKQGACLAEFHDLESAFAWLPKPKNDLPGAAGKPLHSTANT